MENETLTFNDLPMVVARLRDEVAGLKALLTGLLKTLSQQKTITKRKPMNPHEVAEYTGIPLGTIYQKLALGEIPGIKSGKRWVLYPDEIDKWLEVQRKNPLPLTDAELNAAILRTHRRKPGSAALSRPSH
ncbi:MAG: excisionase family DNA-binding protein [Muribaculaceae bacterium]